MGTAKAGKRIGQKPWTPSVTIRKQAMCTHLAGWSPLPGCSRNLISILINEWITKLGNNEHTQIFNTD